jgi:hypothetical protein
MEVLTSRLKLPYNNFKVSCTTLQDTARPSIRGCNLSPSFQEWNKLIEFVSGLREANDYNVTTIRLDKGWEAYESRRNLSLLGRR